MYDIAVALSVVLSFGLYEGFGLLTGGIVFAGLTAVLAIGVMIQILFVVIHKSNLLEKRALICVPPGTSLTLIVV